MNLSILTVSCALVTLLMTSQGVTGDGNCLADSADKDVTIEKLSSVPVWYVQTANQVLFPCTDNMVKFSVQNGNDGFFNLTTINPWLGGADSKSYFLKYIAQGQYETWLATDMNDPNAKKFGTFTFISYYEGTGFAMIICFDTTPDYYYTATAEKNASNNTINTLDQSLLVVVNIYAEHYRASCDKTQFG